MKRVVQISGESGSGKTTRICAMIAAAVARGERAAAIKHTHHPLNEEERGDTERFRRAGARPVILAGETEAVVFDDTILRVCYREAEELLAYTGDAVLVFVEGFKSHVWS